MLLGVLQDGEAVAGVIRMPALGETFAGARGDGATMNGKPISCRTGLKPEARIFINGAIRMVDRKPALLEAAHGLRPHPRSFNDCYPFALLAMGQIDAVVDFDLQPYDYLPVVPVVEAAGGIITDWQGEKLGLESDGTLVAAATPELHEELLRS